MASGRPRQPNDPSVMASVEAAVSTVARPGLFGRLWHWRYELGLIAGVLLATVSTGYVLGLGWLIAVAAATMAVLGAAMTWPPSRRRIIARAWCVITPHRVRTGCTHAWIQTRDGRLPTVLYTTPADFGERVWLWCRAGITPGDLEAARDILRSACWASDVRVVVNDRRSHIVVLEVIRRLPAGRHAGDTPDPAWPQLDRGQGDGAVPGGPASYSGLGHLWPFGLGARGRRLAAPVSRPSPPGRRRPRPVRPPPRHSRPRRPRSRRRRPHSRSRHPYSRPEQPGSPNGPAAGPRR
jgi:hypothetical protein